MERRLELTEFLVQQFFTWKPYWFILVKLERAKGLKRSLTWLKSKYKELGLQRKGHCYSISNVKTLIKTMLKTSDVLRGYRAIWKILRDRYGIIVPRIVVQKALKSVDPEGVEVRKRRKLKRRNYYSKGPNFVWHVDGYDKLSPFGLTIHGCIDGFSRKIMWLKLCPTNSMPKVIVRYYLTAVRENGCPKIVRVDKGTENASLATIHIGFRLDHMDEFAGEKSFIYGPSKHNIRIESWWSQLRRFKTDWWISMLKTWEDEGVLNPSDLLHREILRFTIGEIMENELEEFVRFWNTHRIRKNNQSLAPSGIPEELYDMPELVGAENQAVEVDRDLYNHAYTHESVDMPELVRSDVMEVANEILQIRLGINRKSITAQNCYQIFQLLINCFT